MRATLEEMRRIATRFKRAVATAQVRRSDGRPFVFRDYQSSAAHLNRGDDPVFFVGRVARSINPIASVMNSRCTKAAMSDRLIETTAKPIRHAPSDAASDRPIPHSKFFSMVSIITMASSTTKPTIKAMSEKLSEENPAAQIATQALISKGGRLTPAANVVDDAYRSRRIRKDGRRLVGHLRAAAARTAVTP